MTLRQRILEAVRELVGGDSYPVEVTIRHGRGECISFTFPYPEPAEPLSAHPVSAGVGAAPTHSEDFRVVEWPGLGRFVLTPTQAACVRVLWGVHGSDFPALDQATILTRAGSEASRLHDIFRGSDAWRRLVIAGEGAGTYRLPLLP